MPSASVSNHSAPDIASPYTLTPDQIRCFREEGFLKLKQVLSPQALDYYGKEITRITLAANPLKDKPLSQRDTYGKAFIQVGNVGQASDIAGAFTASPRLARLAAQLLGTRGVRLWHDQALYKEPSGGHTPWHVDQQYWPMASGLCVTAWIPLQAVPLEMGPLAFGRGSHLKNIGRELEISDESERLIRQAIREQGVLEVVEPYDMGEVSFHYGWTLHRAGPNSTPSPRQVHTIIYMDIDMRLAAPKNKNQENDWHWHTPGTQVGQIMADPKNIVLYDSAPRPSSP